MTDEEESKRRTGEFQSSSKLFMEKLGLEEVLAQLLVTEGFIKIDDLARASLKELVSIKGISEALE